MLRYPSQYLSHLNIYLCLLETEKSKAIAEFLFHPHLSSFPHLPSPKGHCYPKVDLYPYGTIRTQNT